MSFIFPPNQFGRCLGFTWQLDDDGQPYHVTPGDAGLGTAWGVTQAVWDAWGQKNDLPPSSVATATQEQLAELIHSDFWNAVQADSLWPGLDLLVYDFGFGGGPRAKFLQQVAGVKQDGIIGQQTLAAVAAITDKNAALCTYSALCESYYRSCRDFAIFGRGWLRRNTARLNLAATWLVPSV